LDTDTIVVQDEYGIPHIYAESLDDMNTVLGYLHARDRLFQMTWNKYITSGRLCEILGGSYADTDRYFRTIGLVRSAQKSLDYYEAHEDDQLFAGILSNVDQYNLGVNTYIDNMNSATTPIEFKILGITPEHFTRLDFFTIVHLQAWEMSGDINDIRYQYQRSTFNNDTLFDDLYQKYYPYNVPVVSEQLNLSISDYPGVPGSYPSIIHPTSYENNKESDLIPRTKLESLISIEDNIVKPWGETEYAGSNNWAVSGSKTLTGKPILCFDPHLAFQTPSFWYEVHATISELGDVTGTSIVGVPGIISGHNEHTAWGGTNGGIDVLDIFVEQLNPSNPNQYLYNGEYHDFEVIDETIHTKEGVDIPFEVKVSVHGSLIDSITPVYDQDPETAPNLAMKWVGNDVIFTPIAHRLFLEMENLQDFYDACYWFDTPSQNILYADDQGNIAISTCGRIPIRSGYDSNYPVQALNDNIGWVGYIPYAYLPRSVNPSQGYLQSANQLQVDPEKYPYDLGGYSRFAMGYRGRRIDSLLSQSSSITVDDMKRYQADTLDLAAQNIVPHVVDAWKNQGDGNATINEVVSWFENWDYSMDIDERAPTIWWFMEYWIKYEICDEIRGIDPSLSMPMTPVVEEIIRANNLYYIDDHTTPDNIENLDDILIRALYDTVEEISSIPEFGKDTSNWVYGNGQVAYYDHIAGMSTVGDTPSNGGSNSINVAWDMPSYGGASCRQVVDLNNIQESFSIHAPGQSGNPSSPHYDDLYRIQYSYDEASGQYGYHPMYFYPSLSDFQAADINGSMIEAIITFTSGGN
jgi:penicillin amidase